MENVKIIDENHIEVNNIAYKATDEIETFGCFSCALIGFIKHCLNIPCISGKRKDKRNVIFIEDNDR